MKSEDMKGLEADYRMYKRLEKKERKRLKKLAKEERKVKDAKTPCNT